MIRPHRTSRTAALATAFIILGALGFAPFPAAGDDSRLNVLLITLDTLRADRVSCYGSKELDTPRIDSLSWRGTLFSRAFCHSPTTLPAHASILLGTTPLSHGVHENSNFVVSDDLLTLAEHLKKKGYATAAFVGAYPVDSRFGLAQGFDLYDDDYGTQSSRSSAFFVERKAEVVVSRALDWLNNRPTPWFAWVHCFDPHDPYTPPPPFDREYEGHPYNGEVAYMDSMLGRLFDHLEKTGLFEKTLVILTGDHGEALGDHGEQTHAYFAYNPTLWIPLILSLPGAKPGRVAEAVSHVDIFPTVCDALEIETPDGLPGRSLLPFLQGKKVLERPIYFESLYPFYSRGWAPLTGFIEGGKKFIDSPIPELYDLTKDFAERTNLAGQSDLAPLRQKLALIKKQQTPATPPESRRKPDSESLRLLRSLGYVSSQSPVNKSFGPEDDIKTLLPLHNRALAAKLLFQKGDARRATLMLRDLVTERNDIDVAYTNLATIYKAQGRPADALVVLEQGLTVMPTNYTIFLAYVNALIDAGRFEDVAKTVSTNHLREMEFDPEIWNYQGIALANMAKLDEALNAYAMAIALDERFASTYVNRAAALVSRFTRARSPRDLQDAAADYERALGLEPQSLAALNGLGVVHRLMGKPDEAVKRFQRALEINPEFGDALFNMGMAYKDKKDLAKALRAFEDYRAKYADRLSPAEQKRLDELIQECRKK